MDLRGCGTALVTPFAADGAVDEAALRRLVRRQVAAGVDFLVPCGTTGETSALMQEERLRVVEVTIEAAEGRVPIFAGCTDNATDKLIRRAKQLAALPGLTGILTANPFYNRPGQEGQYRHFRAMAEAVPLPVLLYNIPSRTAANLEPATVARLAEVPNIVGIKESSGSVMQITEVLASVPPDFKVFAGDDGMALPVIALGGVGLISVASNAFPGAVGEMVRAAMSGDWARAREVNLRYFRIMQAHFLETSPAPVKAVMQMLGLGEDVLRLPMVPVSEGLRRKLRVLLEEVQEGQEGQEGEEGEEGQEEQEKQEK